MPAIGPWGGGGGGSRGWGGSSGWATSGGGYQPPDGQVNINSPQFNWQRNLRDPMHYYEASQDFNPGNPFGRNYRNPATGAIIEHDAPKLMIDGQSAVWTDRMTGHKNINTDALFSGAGGVHGPWEGGGYEGQDPWEQQLLDPGDMIDVEGVIESYRPRMEEEIARGFADAGNRMGKSGFAMSTPYAEALGGVERSALDDFTNTAMRYKYDAASQQKQQEMEAGMFNISKNYDAWAQGGQWGHEGAMQDESNRFGAWRQEGDWNQQNNQFMQQLMASMMQGF